MSRCSLCSTSFSATKRGFVAGGDSIFQALSGVNTISHNIHGTTLVSGLGNLEQTEVYAEFRGLSNSAVDSIRIELRDYPTCVTIVESGARRPNTKNKEHIMLRISMTVIAVATCLLAGPAASHRSDREHSYRTADYLEVARHHRHHGRHFNHTQYVKLGYDNLAYCFSSDREGNVGPGVDRQDYKLNGTVTIWRAVPMRRHLCR